MVYTILKAAALIFVVLDLLFLYCALIVASNEDDWMEAHIPEDILRDEKEDTDDGNEDNSIK